jgi:GxxExxY protein
MELVEKELSFEIVGACFDAFNEVGPDKPEKVYCKALKVCFKNRNISFCEQSPCPIRCFGEKVGSFYLDFLVNDKIILELKVGERFLKKDYDQVKAYLSETGKELGILARFSNDGVTFCRILNPKLKLTPN